MEIVKTIEWDDTRATDKDYLASYYEYRAHVHKINSPKTSAHFTKAAKALRAALLKSNNNEL